MFVLFKKSLWEVSKNCPW